MNFRKLEVSQLALSPGLLPYCLSGSFYLAAMTEGFGDPARFLLWLYVWAIPLWPLLALCHRALGRTLTETEVARVFSPLLVLLLVGLEAVRPLAVLESFLPLLAIGWMGVRASDALARAGGERERRAIEGTAFLGLTLAGLFFLFQPILIHDAFQYVATLRGLLVGRSTDLFEDLFIRNAAATFNPFPEGSLRYLGVPILEVPAVLAGGLAARFLDQLGSVYPPNGYSLPYIISISLLSCFAGIAALLVSYRAARRRASRRSALLASTVFLLASPLVFFTFQWHGWTHTYGALLTALVLDLWLAAADRPGGRRLGIRDGLVFGILGGWGMLVWPPAALIFVLPAIDAVEVLFRATAPASIPGGRRERALSLLAPMAAMGLGAIAAFSPQLTGWKLASGHFLGKTYANVGDRFEWLHPHPLAFLFSGERHGAITWHPVLAFCIAGLFFLRERREKAALVAVVGAEILVLSCWSIWWSGIGFGNRFLLNLSPLFILGLARLFDRVGRARAGPAALAVAFVLVFSNLTLLSVYRFDRIRMGIKPPNFVQDPAPSAASVARLLFVTHPFDPRDLLKPFHSNRNFFSERMLDAVDHHRWGELALLAGALVALASVTAVFAKRLVWRQDEGSRAGPAVAAALLCLSIAADAFLALAVEPGPARVERTHIDDDWRPIEKGSVIEVVPRVGHRPAREIHLLSYLTYSNPIAQGTQVAEVRANGTHGEEAVFPLRAGIETAECSYARPEFLDKMKHRIDTADPVRMWLDDAYSEHLYPLYVYRARLALPHPFEIATIEIRYTDPGGQIHVKDLFLR